jgi:hypothetical protein
MYARVVAGVLCPRNAAVLLLSLPLASRNRLAGDVLKACVLMRSRCAKPARCAAIFITNHACCLDMPLLPPFLVCLRDSNTYRFRSFRPVLVFAKRSITGGKARFAPALRNTTRSSGARRKPRHNFVYANVDLSRPYRFIVTPQICIGVLSPGGSLRCRCMAWLLVKLASNRQGRVNSAPR